MRDNDIASVFGFFTEIGIIAQLSQAMLAKALPDGVHPAHFAIVNHMVRLGDGCTPQQLASAHQVTKGTMTHSLGVLSRHGFVRIEPHPTDGRSKIVYLTDSGRAFREQAIGSVSAMFGQVLDDDHHALMRQAMRSLHEIRVLLDKNREPPKPPQG
ncbi:MarR family winged helix-turn-helix transcriptional regulator [Oricola sp.]|uniref:MarR family winged helix-turn-helix transcriptional regulator n=1 Tax=Oricola sp. TaxID=1979950 RepID=UPI003BAD9A3F